MKAVRGDQVNEVTREDTPDVIGALVRNHQQFLAFLNGRVANRSDAEEILQAAFARGVEKSHTIREGESAVAWFYRLLRNAVIDYYRRRDAEKRALQHYSGSMAEGDEVSHDSEIEQEICRCFNDLLPTLRDEYANLLRRVDLEGASIATVSDETGSTPNNTRVKLHRARKALRKQLERSCGSCAEHHCLDCSCRSSRRAPEQGVMPAGLIRQPK